LFVVGHDVSPFLCMRNKGCPTCFHLLIYIDGCFLKWNKMKTYKEVLFVFNKEIICKLCRV
jgi:hypothetical protein